MHDRRKLQVPRESEAGRRYGRHVAFQRSNAGRKKGCGGLDIGRKGRGGVRCSGIAIAGDNDSSIMGEILRAYISCCQTHSRKLRIDSCLVLSRHTVVCDIENVGSIHDCFHGSNV
jgi:hypothetical protein